MGVGVGVGVRVGVGIGVGVGVPQTIGSVGSTAILSTKMIVPIIAEPLLVKLMEPVPLPAPILI